jgi:hypothetical protein
VIERRINGGFHIRSALEPLFWIALQSPANDCIDFNIHARRAGRRGVFGGRPFAS